ncbi:putative hydrolase C777.06c [Dioscorea cayenensis subsp. rotundata]|uniref:Hydrolase C777.06c n=2 Tax=Dioscorea cayennensis subsp. rotundata TaxID=55577 RepID=A0AB40AL21_DIOCR|nr:putative hydrolase C777.06c [Dioscorea cayenensis subsp. rotundata]
MIPRRFFSASMAALVLPPSPLPASSFARARFTAPLCRAAVPLPPRRSSLSTRLQSSIANGDLSTGSEEQSEIIFVGTGTSEGIPRVSCLTDPSKACEVCLKAAQPGNKNRRRNTSILVRYVSSLGRFNILVDAGKFFYHSALQWFPTYGLRNIDAVIITHSHADAIGGLDDLRDWTNNVQSHIPIYVNNRDFEVMKKTHYYLVDTSVVVPGAAVSELQFNLIKEEPFIVHNLKVCSSIYLLTVLPKE